MGRIKTGRTSDVTGVSSPIVIVGKIPLRDLIELSLINKVLYNSTYKKFDKRLIKKIFFGNCLVFVNLSS